LDGKSQKNPAFAGFSQFIEYLGSLRKGGSGGGTSLLRTMLWATRLLTGKNTGNLQISACIIEENRLNPALS
jgi:hypothetical protein